jgi:hypothetical protein
MKYLKDMKTFLNETYTEAEVENPQKHQYMMLGRLQSDCDYFLGWGKGSVRNLYYDNIPEHIAEMKKLWDMLNIKPEWLSYDDILDYEEKMINYIPE